MKAQQNVPDAIGILHDYEHGVCRAITDLNALGTLQKTYEDYQSSVRVCIPHSGTYLNRVLKQKCCISV